MKYSKAEVGRIFVIRLEDGDVLPSSLEKFADDNGIEGGMCILVGGVRSGGKVVVGPSSAEERPVNPLLFHLEGVHEIAGVGTLFRDEEGKAKLHMHASMGRKDRSVTGCIRPGIQIWQVGEVVFLEIKTTGRRVNDKETGFELLEP